MKRKLSIVNYNSNVTDIARVKRESFGISLAAPSLYIAKNAPSLSAPAVVILDSIWKNSFELDSFMDVENVNSREFLFLFFLDAQGKEQMSSLREIVCSFSHIMGIFISSHIHDSTQQQNFPSIAYSNTKECKSLSRELSLLDPLGGGEYPINYLMIVDSQMSVRYQAPLKFGHCYSAYQKFGLQLAQLHGLVEEYSSFAGTQI